MVAIGDSSISDDGTGDNSGDTLYNGYIVDASGNHQKLLMNAIIWLATATPLSVEANALTDIKFTIAANPIQNKELKFTYLNSDNEHTKLVIYDSLGRIVEQNILSNDEINSGSVALTDLKSGVYFCKISNTTKSKALRFLVR